MAVSPGTTPQTRSVPPAFLLPIEFVIGSTMRSSQNGSSMMRILQPSTVPNLVGDDSRPVRQGHQPGRRLAGSRGPRPRRGNRGSTLVPDSFSRSAEARASQKGSRIESSGTGIAPASESDRYGATSSSWAPATISMETPRTDARSRASSRSHSKSAALVSSIAIAELGLAGVFADVMATPESERGEAETSKVPGDGTVNRSAVDDECCDRDPRKQTIAQATRLHQSSTRLCPQTVTLTADTPWPSGQRAGTVSRLACSPSRRPLPERYLRTFLVYPSANSDLY